MASFRFVNQILYLGLPFFLHPFTFGKSLKSKVQLTFFETVVGFPGLTKFLVVVGSSGSVLKFQISNKFGDFSMAEQGQQYILFSSLKQSILVYDLVYVVQSHVAI